MTPVSSPIALVTGPTSGIGLAFARALASEGHDLVLVSRDLVRLQGVADELESVYDVSCEVVRANLTDLRDSRKVERRLARKHFDVVVNNAGFGLPIPFEDSDIADQQRSLDLLVGAVMRLSHAALGPMLAAGSGSIINVSSVAGYLPRGTYSAHKAWVTAFSSWAGDNYRPRGVQVMALVPGFVRSEFHRRSGTDMSHIPNWMWLDADRLVSDALSDLRRGKSVSIPSWRYKGLTLVARGTPRRLAERLTRR